MVCGDNYRETYGLCSNLGTQAIHPPQNLKLIVTADDGSPTGTDEPLCSRLSGKVEAIEIHHLVPRRHNVTHERLLRVVTSIDFGNSSKLGV